MPLIAFDTETTGLDTRHNCKPFAVIIYREGDDGPTIWEWDVDPLTRQPVIPPEDLQAIRAEVLAADGIVMQNGKFDVGAVESVEPELARAWPWDRTFDTLLDDHLLASIMPHGLDAQSIRWLGVDISPLEKALEAAVKSARSIAKRHLKDWLTAKKGMSGLPSAKDEIWRNDYWLPRAICRYAEQQWEEALENLSREAAEDYCRHEWWRVYADPEHPWQTVLREYAAADPEITLALHRTHEAHIRTRGLENISEVRRKLLPIVYGMEARGLTGSEQRLEELAEKFTEESARAERMCENIAASYDYQLTLPKGANNNSLLNFVPILLDGLDVNGEMQETLRNANLDYGGGGSNDVMFGGGGGENLKLRRLDAHLARTETGRISLNKNSLEAMLAILPERGRPAAFVRNLRNKRKRDTALSYLSGYRRFWVPAGPVAVDPETGAGWYILHPFLNPTGTNTLRWSSSNPNEQNISKQSELCRACAGKGCGACDGKGEISLNLRYVFGPMPGREWYSMDAQNIELRIPAYKANEVEMIRLFENPDEPPYFGSNHLLNFHTVYPDIWESAEREVGWEKAGKHCKKRFASTWYQWCKNGGFAVQYGAVEREEGTADRAFHRAGSHSLLKARFTAIHGPGGLNEQCIRYAEKYGYVETVPDITVDPERGYPIMCTRSDWGRILPTVPLNYYVQGTAMWWMMMSMISCQEFIDDYNRKRPASDRVYMVMQVHDELVFDFPYRPEKGNLPVVREIRNLMAKSGDGIGVPTPVSIEYHQDNWAKGETCE